MKMKSKLFGFGAKMALAAVAVCGMLTSCYEKEEIDATPSTTPDPAKYVIVGNLTDAATGAAVTSATVTIDGAAVAGPNADGYYSKEDLTEGSHVIKVVAEGYKDAVRTVYLQKVSAGGISVGNGDFQLYGVGEDDLLSPDASGTALPEQAQAILDAQKDAIKNAFAGIEGINVDDIIFAVDAQGVPTATIKSASMNLPVGQPLVLTLPTFQGFASTISNERDDLFTKAITDGQVWNASAEKVLGMPYGMTALNRTYTINPGNGSSVLNYTLTITFKSEVLSFLGVEGTVLYQLSWDVNAEIDNHDSHDSHDAHGVNPGAGGGAGE